MKKALLFLIIIIALPFLLSQKPPRNGNKPYVEGQIMVKLRSDVSRVQQEQAFSEFLAEFRHLDLRMEQKISDRLNIVLLNFNPGRLSDQQVLDEIKSYPDVEMAQFNHFIEMRQFIPSDQYFDLQWNMHNTGQAGGTNDADIDGPEAWELGNSGITATGDEIVVAIVDDGFDIDHEDIEYWKNELEIPDNNIDDDTNGYVDDYDGWNAWSNSGVIIERDHGTHVTGIACAWGDNDRGVAGVNLHVKPMPVVGSATVESIVVAAYAYVYDMRYSYNESGGEKGAFIVSTNSSFGVNMGQPEDFPIWGAMYDSMGAVGILSAAATANANWDIDEVGDIPTAFPSDWLITVTNTDDDDQRNLNSGYGLTTIDLGAPGTAVYSTRQNNQYGYKTGCSMSSPHVAGAVGYMFSVADEAFMQAYHADPAGMALVIKEYLLAGVDTLPSLVGKTVTGGRLNVYKAAQLMPVSSLSADIISDHDTVCSGANVLLTALPVGGSGNFTFAWSSSPEGFGSSDSVAMATPDTTTTYYLEISDGNGATATDSINIFVIPFPDKPSILTGPAAVDNFTSTTSTYTCSEITDAISYQWIVEPPEAGTTGSTGTQGEILWANSFTGQATVTVSAVNECGNGEFSDAFTTQVFSSASIDEMADGVQFTVWPNPAREGLRFEFLGLSSGMDNKVVVYNSIGKQIQELQLPDGKNQIELDIKSYPPGIYFATMYEGNRQILTKKFLKIN